MSSTPNTLSQALSPSLRQTVTQFALENFSLDIKFAKSSLVNSFNGPQFPDSEWTSLLAGHAVDGRPRPCLVGVILHIPGTKGRSTRNVQIGYCHTGKYKISAVLKNKSKL